MTTTPPSDETPDWAHSFGSVAEAYERGRPSYPPAAAAWLVGRDAATVLELGAGTGKLTEILVGLGHDVHATEPDRAMLDVLERRVPSARTAVAGAEDIPLADRSVDVVVAAQCFHWFDLDRALPEIARVLRPGGHLAVAWNQRNERIPWVRRLGGLIGTQDQLRNPAEPLVQSALFGVVSDAQFTHWQQVDRKSIQDLVLSRSNIAVLDEAGRQAKLAEVLAFYDDFGRGMDGMQLPYDTLCFRAAVLDRPEPPRRTTADGDDDPQQPAAPPADKPDDDDILLIDFR